MFGPLISATNKCFAYVLIHVPQGRRLGLEREKPVAGRGKYTGNGRPGSNLGNQSVFEMGGNYIYTLNKRRAP